MVRGQPPFPPGPPPRFRSTVHGTVFAGRERHLESINVGDSVRLIPDPPVREGGSVWVHLASGDPIGHLPPEICQWLLPWMRGGGVAEARALRVGGAEIPSWRRVVLEVSCRI